MRTAAKRLGQQRRVGGEDGGEGYWQGRMGTKAEDVPAVSAEGLRVLAHDLGGEIRKSTPYGELDKALGKCTGGEGQRDERQTKEERCGSPRNGVDGAQQPEGCDDSRQQEPAGVDGAAGRKRHGGVGKRRPPGRWRTN